MDFLEYSSSQYCQALTRMDVLKKKAQISPIWGEEGHPRVKWDRCVTSHQSDFSPKFDAVSPFFKDVLNKDTRCLREQVILMY